MFRDDWIRGDEVSKGFDGWADILLHGMVILVRV